MTTSNVLSGGIFRPDFGFQRSLDQRVIISITDTGTEQRRLKHTKEKGTFRTGATNMTKAELDSITSFYRERNGRFDIFVFEDPIENTITGETVESNYQGEATDQLDHTFIISGTETIFEDGSPLADPADYTLNDTIGVITWVTLPANGSVITADYRFYFKVRFDSMHTSRQTDGDSYSVQFSMIEVF